MLGSFEVDECFINEAHIIEKVVYVKCKYLSQSESSRLRAPAPEQNEGRHWQGSPVMNGHA
jgi:hypothetical protein